MRHFHEHAHHFFASGRFGGRHGWGHGGGGGFFGGGRGGMPGARKLSSTDLQLVILALLEPAPAHGYELIRTIEERSGGFYVPSPGVVYPALTFLGEIGHAEAETEGNRKLYRITDEGRRFLEENRAQAETILDALGRVGNRMEQVREAFAGMADLDPSGADDLHRARHALKHALMRKRGCSPDEARRIAQILDRATAEISKI